MSVNSVGQTSVAAAAAVASVTPTVKPVTSLTNEERSSVRTELKRIEALVSWIDYYHRHEQHHTSK